MRLSVFMPLAAAGVAAASASAVLWLGPLSPLSGAGLAGLLAALAGLGGFFAARPASQRLSEVTTALEAARLSQEAERRQARDADLARGHRERERAALDEKRAEENRALQAAVETLGAALQRLADGDLTARIERPFTANLERLRDDFNQSLKRLSEMISTVRHTVGDLGGKMESVGTAADALSRRSGEQAGALGETAAIIRQIMDAIRAATDTTDTASRLADEAQVSSDRSGTIVTEAVRAMERIEQASREISQIINVIDEIAFQTNLLALNAGVEAARAGEAGKGFAVVAHEVRELAQRSAHAAKDIKALITKSGAEVANGVSLVQQTGEALSGIAGQVLRINEHIHAIAAATRDQSSSVGAMSGAVGRLEKAQGEGARAADEATRGLRGLATDTRSLAALVAQFNIEDTGFRKPAERPVLVSVPRPEASAAPVAAQAKAPPVRRIFAPAPVSPTARAVSSPARDLLGKVTSGLGAKPASEDNWEEF